MHECVARLKNCGLYQQLLEQSREFYQWVTQYNAQSPRLWVYQATDMAREEHLNLGTVLNRTRHRTTSYLRVRGHTFETMCSNDWPCPCIPEFAEKTVIHKVRTERT